MKKYIQLLFLFLFPLFPLCGEELVVHLATDKDKENDCSIYIARLRPCESTYEKTIYETFQYDFAHNGRCSLLPISEELQFYAFHKDETEAFQVKRWKTHGARFVVVPSIEGNLLHVKLFDTQTASLKTLRPVSLSRNIDSDLRKIHKVSDDLHKLMFGIEGIASKRILFSYQQKQQEGDGAVWHAEIWEMGSDGKGQRQVTKENHYSITPTFLANPSGGESYRFAYVTYKQGQPRIYFSDKDSTRGHPIIPLRGNQFLPDFSPKGDKIAFISDADGRADLFVQSFHPEKGSLGKPAQIYSFPSSVQASPSFSPNGEKIAFVSDKDRTPRVYIVRLCDLNLRQKTPQIECISTKNRDNTSPSWSPDGKKIAYSSRTNGVRQIWIYDIEKKEERQLTSGLGDKENPKWASNSLHMVYNTTAPTYDIYIVNLNQIEPIRLTEGPGLKHYPAFEP
jgi:TolB protein